MYIISPKLTIQGLDCFCLFFSTQEDVKNSILTRPLSLSLSHHSMKDTKTDKQNRTERKPITPLFYLSSLASACFSRRFMVVVCMI